MDALERMVNMRRDICDLDPQVQIMTMRFVQFLCITRRRWTYKYRSDVLGAIYFVTKPRFISQSEEISLFSTMMPKVLGASHRELPSSTRLSLYTMDSRLVECFTGLITLSENISEYLSHYTGQFAADIFLGDFGMIQHKLMSVLHTGGSPTEMRHMQNAPCLGALIYLKSLTKEIPMNHNELLHLLKSTVVDGDLHLVHSSLTLWLLFVGGAASAASSLETSWFVLMIAQLAKGLQIRTWSDAETRIKELGYIEQMHHTIYMALWEEAQSVEH
jgi:hypothetical protein